MFLVLSVLFVLFERTNEMQACYISNEKKNRLLNNWHNGWKKCLRAGTNKSITIKSYELKCVKCRRCRERESENETMHKISAKLHAFKNFDAKETFQTNKNSIGFFHIFFFFGLFLAPVKMEHGIFGFMWALHSAPPGTSNSWWTQFSILKFWRTEKCLEKWLLLALLMSHSNILKEFL